MSDDLRIANRAHPEGDILNVLKILVISYVPVFWSCLMLPLNNLNQVFSDTQWHQGAYWVLIQKRSFIKATVFSWSLQGQMNQI